MSGELALACECIAFIVFVFISTCAPLWRPSGTSAGGAGAKLSYVFAGGGVSTLTMILSVARGTLGVRSFLGYPSELVYRGAAMWEILYGTCLAFPVVSWLLVPLYLRLRTTSVYEYLQMRFKSEWIRRAASGTFVVRQTLNLAVTVYTPCVALHAATGLPTAASAAVLAVVSAAFTLRGGLSAAIRADVIQTVTMVLISVAFIVQSTIRAGGPGKVLQTNIDGGRLNFFNFTWDPRTRVDTLSAIVGQMFMSVSIYGCQQTFVQRYCSMPSEKAVRNTLALCVPAVALLFSLSWVVGCGLYAVYVDCDPLASQKISSPDEVLPYYVRDQFSFLPGVMGLFLGSLFNGALSFLVSNVNSLATVTWEDFVSAAPPFRGTGDKQQLVIIKIIGLFYILTITLLSLCVGAIGGVIEGSQLVTAATSGALLGVFVLAVACPLADGKATLAGGGAAHAVVITLAIGRLCVGGSQVEMLPTSTDSCPNATLTQQLPSAINQTLAQLESLLKDRPAILHPPPAPSLAWSILYYLFSISYMWYSVIGTIVCVIIGNVVGVCTPGEDAEVDARLLHPLAVRLARRIPCLGANRLYYTEEKQQPTVVVVEEIANEEKTKTTQAEVSENSVVAEAKAEELSATACRLFDAYAQRTRF